MPDYVPRFATLIGGPLDGNLVPDQDVVQIPIQPSSDIGAYPTSSESGVPLLLKVHVYRRDPFHTDLLVYDGVHPR